MENGVLRAQPEGPGGRRTVLVVDDDQGFVQLLRGALEGRGFAVKTATSADRALALAADFGPDAVVLEVRLGQENGLALIPALRKSLPDVVCVVATRFPDIESAIAALRYRADDYLRKPLEGDEVVRALRRCLGRVVAKRRTRYVQARENLFGRLLVRRFSHLFVEDETGHAGDRVISRRILPGFFVAVDMMLGPELVEEYQRRCRDIVNRLSPDSASDILWEDYYADDEANRLALDAAIKMALHFREIDKRVVWLATLINNHVGAASHRPSTQLITPSDTMVLLSYLFSDLAHALGDRAGREFISRHYGEETLSRLSLVVDRFRPSLQHPA